jgi:hypothetical protein
MYAFPIPNCSGGGLVANATAIAHYVNKFMAWGLGHGRAARGFEC